VVLIPRPGVSQNALFAPEKGKWQELDWTINFVILFVDVGVLFEFLRAVHALLTCVLPFWVMTR